MQHFFSYLFIFSLPFDNKKNAIDYLSFQAAGGIVYFKVEHFKRSFGGVVKFWGCSVGMHNKVD